MVWGIHYAIIYCARRLCLRHGFHTFVYTRHQNTVISTNRRLIVPNKVFDLFYTQDHWFLQTLPWKNHKNQDDAIYYHESTSIVLNALISASPYCRLIWILIYGVQSFDVILKYLFLISLFHFKTKLHTFIIPGIAIFVISQSSVILLSTRFRFLFLVCDNSFLVSYTSDFG